MPLSRAPGEWHWERREGGWYRVHDQLNIVDGPHPYDPPPIGTPSTPSFIRRIAIGMLACVAWGALYAGAIAVGDLHPNIALSLIVGLVIGLGINWWLNHIQECRHRRPR